MKTALITGASSGIGASLAVRFSAAGFEVYLVGRDESRLKNLQNHLAGPSKIFVSDLLNENDLKSFMASLSKDPSFQKNLKVLINNAGQFQRKPFPQLKVEDLDQQYRLQVVVPTLLSQLCAPYLGRHDTSGSIINISSTLGLKPVSETAHYSTAKAALINLTQIMAIELAPKVRVNCICPGIVDTPIHASADTGTKKLMDSLHLTGRMGKPEEIAELAFFLASDLSQWTTGSVVTVDGGIGLK